MTDIQIRNALKDGKTGQEYDLTIRYQLRNKDGINSTFGFVDGTRTHCLYIDELNERIQAIKKVSK